jgi:hypothetical protein
MAQNFAGAAFNYTPDQLRKVFDPGGLTFDTTNRFNLGSLGSGSIGNTGTTRQNLPDISKYGELGQAVVLSNFFKPSQAEELKTLIPMLKEMDAFKADLANKNAERKFGQELLGAGIGALGRGITTSVAGGSPAILGALAQAPLTGAEMFQRGLQIPFTPAQPMSPRQYQSQRYFS